MIPTTSIILLILISFLLLEFYIYKGVKNSTENKSIKIGYLGITSIFYVTIIYLSFYFTPKKFPILASLIIVFILPKILGAIVLAIDDLLRFTQFITRKNTLKQKYYPERRRFLSVLALGITAISTGLILDGIFFGKFRHRVRKIKLKLKNLPKNFTGYKIIQISDVHSGSFDHPKKLQHAIELINQQEADLVLFTGDLVNNYADEFQPFISLFSKIKAKDGKFSVLGNHDYGLYGNFENDDDRKQNLHHLIQFQKAAGFEILRNEHKIINRNGENLYILGVENWGEPPFPQYGDLDKATEGVPQKAVKILMSHDPTHFDAVVKHHPKHIQLTLSGHTHGMQFGLDLKNIKWSPVQYRYKKWIDLYESREKYLYVNRGFGVIGFQGRVGIYPEITLIELA